MKKVSVVVVYDKNKYIVKAITAIHKGNHIPLVRANSELQLKQATSLHDMYNKVLSLLKANNMYPSYMEAFDRKFYDIAWVNVQTFAIERFGYTEKGSVW